MVAAPHSQQDPGVMRENVGEPINPVARQANSKETACDFRIVHDALDLIQTTPRNFGIDVQKPKNVAVCDVAANVHLCCSIAFAYDKLIATASREIGGAIRAFTICDNNLRSWRSLAQLVKKWPY
jgi:hypothetical protein